MASISNVLVLLLLSLLFQIINTNWINADYVQDTNCPTEIIYENHYVKVPVPVIKPVPIEQVIRVPYLVPVKVYEYIPIEEKYTNDNGNGNDNPNNYDNYYYKWNNNNNHNNNNNKNPTKDNYNGKLEDKLIIDAYIEPIQGTDYPELKSNY